uniref:Protein kinase domain-containing protein n=1 Tax=Mesocestoides corti TaxID=53468 RepID=A0A5K3F945_MESCO
MEVGTLACKISLIHGPDGEKCFEEVHADYWLRSRRISPFEEVNAMLLLQPGQQELPMESLLMRNYAQTLMAQNNETHLASAWGDPFTSAEVYIQQRCLRDELIAAQQANSPTKDHSASLSLEEVYFSRRRKAVHFDKPPLGDESLSPSPPEHTSQEEEEEATVPEISDENRQSELAELPTANKLPLKRKDCHLIDVSNYFLGQSLQAPSTPVVATQLFSPGQVRELLLKQLPLTSPSEEGTEMGVDPWCSKFMDLFWLKISPRMSSWSNYRVVEPTSPPKSVFTFGEQHYAVEGRLGSGTYGVVYLARLLSPSSGAGAADLETTTVGCRPEAVGRSAGTGILRVVKLEVPDFPLEFYYLREARRRVATAFRLGKALIDVRSSICPALALTHSVGRFTCLLMPFYPVGLLTWLNYGLCGSGGGGRSRAYCRSLRLGRHGGDPPPLEKHEDELVALYLTLELLWLVEGLHKHAGIIHGDIKPDNFRINDRFPLLDVAPLDEVDEDGKSNDFTSCLMSGRSTKVLVLLDFGLCIDMARFPAETVFKVDKSRTAKRSFPCIEMLTNRPWTYQLDLFNIAGVIYTLVFKRYMKVECFNGEWKPAYLPRSSRNYRAIEVWTSILSALLNVKSCSSADYPDLEALRAKCERFLQANAAEYNLAAERANAILTHLTPPST